MKSSNKYLLLLVAILVLSLGVGLYFKFSPRAYESMTTMPTQTPAPIEATVSELPKSTPLPTRTPLPVLNETPTSSDSGLNVMSSSDLLTQAKNKLKFSEL